MKPARILSIILWLICEFGFLNHVCFAQNSDCPQKAMKVVGKVGIPSANSGYGGYFVHDPYFITCTNYDGPNQLIVVDFSDPANLYREEYRILGGTGPKNIEGGDAYGACLQWPFFYHPCEEGLEIADLTDPFNPTIVSRYEIREATGCGGVICVAGPTALFSHARSSNLEVLDLSNVAAPRRMAILDLDDDPLCNRQIEARTIFWDGGQYAYLYAGNNSGQGIGGEQLIVLDLQDRSNPVVASRLLCENGNRYGSRMIRDGNRIYYPFYADPRRYSGIQTIDVSDPLSPVLHDPVPTEETIYYAYPYREGFLTTYHRSTHYYYQMNGRIPVKLAEYILPCGLSTIAQAGTAILGIGTWGTAYYFYILQPDSESGLSGYSDYR